MFFFFFFLQRMHDSTFFCFCFGLFFFSIDAHPPPPTSSAPTDGVCYFYALPTHSQTRTELSVDEINPIHQRIWQVFWMLCIGFALVLPQCLCLLLMLCLFGCPVGYSEDRQMCASVQTANTCWEHPIKRGLTVNSGVFCSASLPWKHDFFLSLSTNGTISKKTTHPRFLI